MESEVNELDIFGRLIVKRLRDRSLQHCESLQVEWYRAPRLAKLQSRLAALTDEQRALVAECVQECTDNAIHDFLFTLGEGEWEGVEVRCTVGGVDVGERSDGLQGEPYGDNGWYRRFSAYPGIVGEDEAP